MKKAAFNFSVLFGVLSVLAGCRSELPGPLPPRLGNSYIWCFIECDEIIVYSRPFYIEEKHGQKHIYYREKSEETLSIANGTAIAVMLVGNNFIFSKDKEFQEYVTQMGDTLFNYKKALKEGYGNDSPYAITKTLETVAVTCDKEYNATYPAGSNLNNLLSVCINDYQSFVKNGYQLYNGEDAYKMEVAMAFDGIYRKFAMEETDFSLYPFMNPYMFILLEQAPEQTDTYSFTVTVKLTDGRTLTATADPITIEGEAQ